MNLRPGQAGGFDCHGRLDRRSGGWSGRVAGQGKHLTVQRQHIEFREALNLDQDGIRADLFTGDGDGMAGESEGVIFAGGKGFVVDDGEGLAGGDAEAGELELVEPGGGGLLGEGARGDEQQSQ